MPLTTELPDEPIVLQQLVARVPERRTRWGAS
jgi:hypothetical protein